MVKFNNKWVVINFFLLLNSPNVMANSDWFFSLGIGQSNAQFEANPENVISTENTDTSFHAILSYQFSDKLRANLAFVDLGDGLLSFAAETADPGALQADTLSIVPVLGNGRSLSLEYDVYSVKNLSFNGELGIYRWEADLDSDANGNRQTTQIDGTDWFMGIGTRFRISENVLSYLKFNRYNLEPNRVNEVHLGLTYQF